MAWPGCGPVAQLPVVLCPQGPQVSCKVQAPPALLLAAPALAGLSRLVWDAVPGGGRDGKGEDPAESRAMAGGLREARAMIEEGTA